MHRTQILLEEWQYDALKALAEREGRSISSIVREFLGRQLQRKRERGEAGLRAIEGIADAPESYGRSHDDVLYGKS